MPFPLEHAVRREREAFLATVDGLTDADFESGPTLCAGWAPRDVLAHLLDTDRPWPYLRRGLRFDPVNAEVVAEGRRRSREELALAGQRWATAPSAFGRAAAGFLLGDLGVHHQDVLRGLGGTREVPGAVGAAILREGVFLSTLTNRRVFRHRLLPTTGTPIGRGRPVHGTPEALGLWLTGRDAVASELVFG